MRNKKLENVTMFLVDDYDWVIQRDKRANGEFLTAIKCGGVINLKTTNARSHPEAYKQLSNSLLEGVHLELQDERLTMDSRLLLIEVIRTYFTDPIAEWILYHRKVDTFAQGCKRWNVLSHKKSAQAHLWK